MQRNMSLLAGITLVLPQIITNPQRALATTAMIFCNGGMGSASGLTPNEAISIC